MHEFWAILGAAILFAAFGLLQRKAPLACAQEECEERERPGGCGACTLRPLPREREHEPS